MKNKVLGCLAALLRNANEKKKFLQLFHYRSVSEATSAKQTFICATAKMWVKVVLPQPRHAYYSGVIAELLEQKKKNQFFLRGNQFFLSGPLFVYLQPDFCQAGEVCYQSNLFKNFFFFYVPQGVCKTSLSNLAQGRILYRLCLTQACTACKNTENPNYAKRRRAPGPCAQRR